MDCGTRSAGYRLSPIAEDVLAALGGLSLGPIVVDGPNFTNDEPLTIDPVLAGSGHRGLAVELAEAIGGNWYPIGEWLSFSSVFIDDGGRVVATGLGWAWELGSSIEDAIEFALLANHPLVCMKRPRRRGSSVARLMPLLTVRRSCFIITDIVTALRER